MKIQTTSQIFRPQNRINNITFGKYTNKHIDIIRFQNIDNTLYRGGRPHSEQIKQLRNIGISTIIDLTTTGYSQKKKALVKSNGMNYVNLPFPAYKNPTEEYVKKFLDITEKAKQDNKKVYIHCREGKDRTGLFSAMYKIKNNLSDLSSIIQEMINIGHNNVKYPNLILFLKDFYYRIHPAQNTKN